MEKIKNILFVIVFMTITLSDVPGQVRQSEISPSERRFKLTWEEVGGAVSYIINIKDSKGNIIINKESDSSSIILELQPDNYKIRIGSINKFGKVGSWSDWDDLIIEKPVIIKPGEEKEKEITGKDVPRNFKLGIGWSYFMIQPDWNKYYKDSYYACAFDMAYSFRSINFPSYLKFIRFAGIDIESNYVSFAGKEPYNKVESDMTNIISGINLFIPTSFDFPLNFALRGGGGISYTILDFKKFDNAGNQMEKGSSGTWAQYYKAGVSLECRLSSRYFLEGYADYYTINYLAMDFKVFRFSLLAGFKF